VSDEYEEYNEAGLRVLCSGLKSQMTSRRENGRESADTEETHAPFKHHSHASDGPLEVSQTSGKTTHVPYSPSSTTT